MNFESEILLIERILNEHYGDLKWWPARTIDEVLIGAILTQNTSWTNVEKAMENLRIGKVSDLNNISKSDISTLSQLIRPSGFYNQKSRRLLKIAIKISTEFGNLKSLKKKGLPFCEKYLSEFEGIGKETLDSILLYALVFPKFVIDKYTLRFFERLGIWSRSMGNSMLEMIPEILENNVLRLKNFHATIVEISKNYCRAKPICPECLMNKNCDYYREIMFP
ncbi:endonuclease III [mine drainage metagenome]|uniref:Endonuclease III n=1 Tax=mine drainage metagenome TaxID=410659 RepID=T1A6H2_9ZZZZ